jgi:branched-chain amino acid transport system ATP-binding protein
VANALLEVKALTVSYRGALALHGVSLSVGQGESVSIVGPNGAGKTSLLRAISGLVRSQGEIRLDGESIAGLAPEHVVRRGVVHCPQAAQLFPEMTVLENLDLGAFTVRDGSARREALESVFQLFPKLADRRTQRAGTLSGGERQMVAIGRSLMSRPRLLMLDEPSLGLAPLMRDRIEEAIRQVHRTWGLTVILVEQDTAFAMDIADRVYVLDGGQVVRQGPVAEIAGDPAIRKAYLGVA